MKNGYHRIEGRKSRLNDSWHEVGMDDLMERPQIVDTISKVKACEEWSQLRGCANALHHRCVLTTLKD